jgi:hypothetical protein
MGDDLQRMLEVHLQMVNRIARRMQVGDDLYARHLGAEVEASFHAVRKMTPRDWHYPLCREMPVTKLEG